MRIIELNRTATDSNDRDAELLRRELNEKCVFLVNVMSSAGAGKTTLLLRILKYLGEKIRIGVIEADIDSSVDAEKIVSAGGAAIQAHTDGMCHMDAGMTKKALESFGTENADLIFLENVGNLICPAEYDTGAQMNLMILSVPEGDDKPLKYPLMFSKSDVLVVTKTDAKPYFDFDDSLLEERVKKLNPSIRIFYVSAKEGTGMSELEEYLSGKCRMNE